MSKAQRIRDLETVLAARDAQLRAIHEIGLFGARARQTQEIRFSGGPADGMTEAMRNKSHFWSDGCVLAKEGARYVVEASSSIAYHSPNQPAEFIGAAR